MKIGILTYEFCKDEEFCNAINSFLKENPNIDVINVFIDFRIGYKLYKVFYKEFN